MAQKFIIYNIVKKNIYNKESKINKKECTKYKKV